MAASSCATVKTSGFVLWFTGLPCAGKSTLASAVHRQLRNRGCRTELLDADVLRETLCSDLSYTRADRDENVARIGWVCDLLNRHDVIAIAAVISPFRESRERLRASVPGFIEVYVKASLTVCIERDVKGLYARAMAGEIHDFTGINSPYEEPVGADIVVETDQSTVEWCVRFIVTWLEQRGFLAPSINSGEKSPLAGELILKATH